MDECKEPSLNTCGEHTNCLNNPGGYECECKSGYISTVNGKTKGKDLQCKGNFTRVLLYYCADNFKGSLLLDGAIQTKLILNFSLGMVSMVTLQAPTARTETMYCLNWRTIDHFVYLHHVSKCYTQLAFAKL